MVVVCETRLTTVKAINSVSSSFSYNYDPAAPESSYNTTTFITVNRNECDLTISSILNYKVVVTVPGKNPITIYSTGTYHIESTRYRPNISISFFPIDKNSIAYCRGSITTT